MLSAGPVCSCAHFSCTLHTRPRVQRAPGLPCALCLEGHGNHWQNSGASRRENVAAHSVVIVRESGRSSIPETPMIEPRSRGVLDRPPSRATTAVIGDTHYPTSFRGARSASPESISPQRLWSDGFRTRRFASPRNDGLEELSRSQNPLKPAQFFKKLEGQTDEYSSRQYAFWCGPAGQAFGRPEATHREGKVH